ncbi:hypothetical protein CEXT_330331 [Caerostris extrusa]|uniref:Uncharacterized protein n=1 Tax=Caerostris extrusa TaxID=172846 RepID=A0AAV4XG47_CAEEX|nr:hypothetical protein CEXT_330331 [Caerostris extrusa]
MYCSEPGLICPQLPCICSTSHQSCIAPTAVVRDVRVLQPMFIQQDLATTTDTIPMTTDSTIMLLVTEAFWDTMDFMMVMATEEPWDTTDF